MKKIRVMNILCLLVLLCFNHLDAVASEKQTIYNSPYVTFSPDGQAWTTNAGDTDYEQYINPYEDIKVTTELTSSLRALKAGEHYYKIKRRGEIPISQWVVEHERTSCVHGAYPSSGYFHGILYGTQKCLQKYYSGWRAYCADCGERITDMYLYMSMEAAASIDYLEVSQDMDYFYLCPHCNNLEQGSSMEQHSCKAISWNQYKVVYEANTDFAPYGGFMEDSIHMYNNASEYEGESIQAATHLTKNAYTRIGYEFVGWNTKPDGSGAAYEDGTEIYNLSEYDWNETDEGIVVLYAQWIPSKSILEIHPAGGRYLVSSGITIVAQNYGSSYVADSSNIIPPDGYTLTFETNGGRKVSPITGTQSFKEWIQKPLFQGRMEGETYYFLAPNGSRDRLEASYKRNPVVLPETTMEGRSFGGWYGDEELTEYVGGAGTEIIPQKDMTLYALWVDLKLEAENNMTANDGAGAVDLEWSQADTKDKVYRLYQQGENADDWLQIHSANDIGSISKVVETFLYTGSKKMYTVPHTGLYTLTLNGAQGGGFGAYEGGLGGRVTAKVWLSKGEVLTYNVGGQNGYNCGGAGATYGSNGGGRTSIYSNLKGTLLIAGGGGGASVNGNGGAGGSGANLGSTGEYGESGHAGGGGGYVGGKAGEVIVHTHKEACYLDHMMLETTSSTSLIDEHRVHHMDSWLSLFQSKYGAFATATGDCYSVVTGLNSLRATTTASNRFLVMEYGRIRNPNADGGDASTWYTAPELSPAYSAGYIPVNGNKKVTIDVLLNGMHEDTSGAIDEAQTYLKVYNQNGEQIFSKFSSDVTRTTTSYYEILNLDTANTCKFISDTGNVEAVRFVETISIPEGTESIYFTAQIRHNALDCWMEIDVNKVVFAGGKNNPVICGFEDNQVISAKPAYGGNNYVNTKYISSYTEEKGKKQGNGSLSMQSEMLSFLDGLELKAVVATDYAAPDTISIEDENLEWGAIEDNTFEITWKEPEDNGTLYKHKAESYVAGAQKPLCTSNITENVLTSGVAGYYFRIDTISDTTVTKDNGTYVTAPTVTITLSNQKRYLHVAAVDVAGNLGDTVSIPIGSNSIISDVVLKWPLVTEQLQIEECANVYPAAMENAYYVRSDGKTPFTLRYGAEMRGLANMNYQLNYITYESTEGIYSVQNTFFLPSDSIQEGAITIGEARIQYSVNGKSMLERYPYSQVKRLESNRRISAVQKFTLREEASGKTLQLFPRAGANAEDGIVYSEQEEDRLHGITIIGDGAPPDISGLEMLNNKDVLSQNEYDIELLATAFDAVSGVKEFYIKVSNLDNKLEKIYKPDDHGTIRVKINGEEQVFQGDFTVMAYAVDNVGNEYSESYSAAEFALEATVERILEPHNPVFKGGESGVLNITTLGYAEYVEVEFPEELLLLNPELKSVYYYTEAPQYKQQEQQQFMIPLYAPANESYTITVRAYKENKVLEACPVFSVIDSGGSILEEVRTRLR